MHPSFTLTAIDDLTGVFNRRNLIQLANEEFGRFEGNSRHFSVLMIDIDHFKEFNDSYGHEVGDRILARFASYVANNLNVKNIWGRLGGEEFVLVLPNLPCEEAKIVADCLRLGLNEAAIVPQGEPLAFTISIGLTEAQVQDMSFGSVLQRADKALYAAKRNGRNRTEVL